jgi:hypothetical protein
MARGKEKEKQNQKEKERAAKRIARVLRAIKLPRVAAVVDDTHRHQSLPQVLLLDLQVQIVAMVDGVSIFLTCSSFQFFFLVIASTSDDS